MAWSPDISVADIRAMYPLLTVALRADVTVTADINAAKAEAESFLRGKYDLTNPALDAMLVRATKCRALALGLAEVYGTEGWDVDMAGALSYYGKSADAFYTNLAANRIHLCLTPVTFGPSVTNETLGTAERSQFDLDSKADHALDLITDE